MFPFSDVLYLRTIDTRVLRLFWFLKHTYLEHFVIFISFILHQIKQCTVVQCHYMYLYCCEDRVFPSTLPILTPTITLTETQFQSLVSPVLNLI